MNVLFSLCARLDGRRKRQSMNGHAAERQFIFQLHLISEVPSREAITLGQRRLIGDGRVVERTGLGGGANNTAVSMIEYMQRISN